jgi:hypothetical protein
MRQVGDTLVWLGLITVVAAVIYFTPRLASLVSAAAADRGAASGNHRTVVLSPEDLAESEL